MLNKDFGFTFVSGLIINTPQNGYDGGNLFVSDPFPGDGVYHKNNGVHTIMVDASNLTANISIQATVNKDPINFANVPMTSMFNGIISDQLVFRNQSEQGMYQITGAYTWIRAVVSEIQDNANTNYNYTNPYAGVLHFLKIAY